MSDPERRLTLVIPTVVSTIGGDLLVDGDFANNLEAYLSHFQSVLVLCPPSNGTNAFPSVVPISAIRGNERLEITVLPEPYREDRYLAHKRYVSRLLKKELLSSDCVLISPHAPLDWSTLAAEKCIELGIPYNMEADWDLPQVAWYNWSQMPFGMNKLRKYFLREYHKAKYFRCLRHSALALVQGRDVYEAYRHIAPNCHEVLNIQVTPEDHIPLKQVATKMRQARSGKPLRIVYAGRASEMKGPLQWLETVDFLRNDGAVFHATWAGDGPYLPRMRAIVSEKKLGDVCHLPGKVTRQEAKRLMLEADIFMFCHMGNESPRCLVESLAAGTPIFGYRSGYAESLVEMDGGGRFVERNDTAGLTREIVAVADDRETLATLIGRAAASGRRLDRDQAIEDRIELMKTYLRR